MQVIALNGQAGVDTGSLSSEAVADLFGKTAGFRLDEPNVTVTPTETTTEDDDLDF